MAITREISNDINLSAMQAHLSNLKLFNYTRTQDTAAAEDTINGHAIPEYDWNNLKTLSVSNLLKENSNFLKNISDK